MKIISVLICMLCFGLHAEKKNVLFISIDDLRPELGCYGVKEVLSPNIDRLAKEGFVFDNAYCQQAVCNPSRVSLLCGQRPDTTKVWKLETRFRDIQPDVVTLPEYFKNHGYETVKVGKIYHTAHGNSEDFQSWTKILKEKAPVYHLKGRGKKPSTENADVSDNQYVDGASADKAIEFLNSTTTKPFFLAVGFKKPHLPFTAPQKYWDLYQKDTLPKAPLTTPPENTPDWIMYNFSELRGYSDINGKGSVSPAKTAELRHGYYACVSYVDAQVGRIIQTLKEKNLYDNTVIILWSDHGWKLNDYGNWCKHSNLEIDTRVPLIVRTPGLSGGVSIKGFVELVDIYPSLAELCDLKIPSQCEGKSFVDLLNNPQLNWKEAAFSQYPRKGNLMGYTMRYKNWRYTEWINQKNGKIELVELYDHTHSRICGNNEDSLEKNKALIQELSRILNKGQGWKIYCK